MSSELRLHLSPLCLDVGDPEEVATFGMFCIFSDGTPLTEGFDFFAQSIRPGPLVPGYHAAEWFVQNWWRLCHEPFRPESEGWRLTHRMPAIGAGYVWPNVEFRSDTQRVKVIAKPSSRQDAKPFRYFGHELGWEGDVADFRAALGNFVVSILALLEDREIQGTQLQRLWGEICQDEQDPDRQRARQLEGLLGKDWETSPAAHD